MFTPFKASFSRKSGIMYIGALKLENVQKYLTCLRIASNF